MVTFYPKITLATNCQHESFKNDVDHFQESRNNKQTYHYNIGSLSRRTQRGEAILVQVIILGCKGLLASNYCALVLHTTRIPYCQFYSKNRPFNILLENALLLTYVMTIIRGCYETDSHPSPQFYHRHPTVNHSKQAGGGNNTNMVERRILYKSINNERIQTSQHTTKNPSNHIYALMVSSHQVKASLLLFSAIPNKKWIL